MKKENLLKLAIAFIFGSMLIACEQNYVKDESSDTDTEATDTSVNTLVEDTSDYSYNLSSGNTIVLNTSSITTTSSAVTISGTTATITAGGTYIISGTLSNGQIIVNSSDDNKVKLVLNTASITYSSGSPLWIIDAKKTIIILPSGSQNYLTDGSSYASTSAEDSPNAALFCMSDLVLYGSGALTVKGNYKDGITSKDGLYINSGNITVTAADDGIRGKDYLVVDGGTITITSGGDGLKSDNTTSSMGYISLLGGTENVTSTGDGIAAYSDLVISSAKVTVVSGGGSSKTASSTVSSKGLKSGLTTKIYSGTISVNSADDAVHTDGTLLISGGTLTALSGDDGLHAETSITMADATIDIQKSYEGVESGLITFNSGKLSIVASDDGFNASKGNGGENDDGSYLYINGGYVYVNASSGDALDSNGSMAMTGGTVVANGPNAQPELAIDYNGTFKISGGLLVALGATSAQSLSTSSSQYSVTYYTSSGLNASSLFHVQDASGNDILTFKPIRNQYSIIFSTPDLAKGSTYYIYTGGSYSTTATNGLYTGGTYTPGTSATSFTISSMVTTVGSSSGGGGTRP